MMPGAVELRLDPLKTEVLHSIPLVASVARTSYNFTMPVEVVRRGAAKRYPARPVKDVADEVLRLLERENVELSLALVGNAEMRKLNAKYRGKDYVTDVLSFPAEDHLPGPVRLLGDVVICIDKMRAQAKERGRSLQEEMTTLLIHGIVHLLGYDHERSARDARIMERLERKIYRELCERGYLSL
jgi:probable rRNA maturation factor